MNERREKIAQILTQLAEYYDKPLSLTQLGMYVEDLVDIDPSQLIRAALGYRKDPRNSRFPLPWQLRAVLSPPETDEENARLAASRILTAVMRIGPYQVERAREYVGTLGWQVVEQQGGWLEVVGETENTEVGILQAQWRELARAIIGQAKRGELRKAPELPKRQDLAPVGESLRMLSKKRPEES